MKSLPFEIHPAAELFPMMAGEAFEEFVKDVQQNGVREPIIIWNGKLLDGRNRSAACLRLGMNPLDYACDLESDDVDPVAYVLSANLHRRHLDTTDQAKIGLAVEKLYAAEAKKRQGARTDIKAELPESSKGQARDKAAAAVGVSPRTISDAKRVYESGNQEIIEAVDKKEMSISKAAKAVAPPKPRKEKPSAPKPAPKPQAKEKAAPTLEAKAEASDESHDYDYPVVKAFQSADYRLNTLREIVKTLSHAERVILAVWLEESK